MKIERPPTARRPHRRAILATTIAALFAAHAAHAAPITWSAATTIAGDADVITAGLFGYGYDFANLATTVNGVAFTGSNSFTALGTDVTLAGFAATNTTAFGSGAGNPFALLSAAYRNLLRGGTFTNGTPVPTATVTLNNLTIGRTYAAQVWVNDNRAGATATRTETISSPGGNTILLDYDSTNAAGGVGQFSVGLFAANAATQAFTLLGNASSQMNALQLRDVTNLGAWVGTGGATWDTATTNNFASNLFNAALNTTTFAAAQAPIRAVVFADVYWNSGATVPVTQTAVTIAAGGVSTGTVMFQNSALNYTIASSDAVGITGATNVTMLGTGMVTLDGAHTFTGAATIAAGTLKVGTAQIFTGSNALHMSGTGALELNGFNATFSTTSSAATTTISDNGLSAGLTTLSFIQTTNAAAIIGAAITEGAGRDIAVRITNANGTTSFTNPNSNFSGGLTLLHNVSGTRLTLGTIAATTGGPGAITSGPYGTGPITVGLAATDRAGLYFTVAGQTLVNDLVMNTALGTDRPGFRFDTTGNTLSGTITANLAPATFSTNTNGGVSLTGRVTGPRGLTLDNTFGTTINVTLNNATASPNDYQGDTTIAGTKGSINLGAADQIPNGASAGNVVNNGAVNLNGFNETINGLSGTGTVNGNSGAPTLIVGDNNAGGTFSGIVRDNSGVLALTKIGNGAQVLGGVNAYTGATTVSGGKLFVNGSLDFASTTTVGASATLGGLGTVNGPVIVSNGGALEAGHLGQNALNLANVTFGAASGDLSTIVFSNLAGGANAGVVNVLDFNGFTANGGAASIRLAGNVAGLTGGTYKLIGYSGAALGTTRFADTFTKNSRQVLGIADSAGTQIELTVATDPPKWTGLASGEWSTATLGAPKNWKLITAGTQTDFITSDAVLFEDLIGGTSAVDITGANVATGSVTFNNQNTAYTVSSGGVFGISDGLVVKNNTGTVTIATANSYTGGTTVNAGSLVLSGDNNFGIGTVLVNGGTATLSGANTYTGATTLNAGGTLNLNNASAIGAGTLAIFGGTLDNTNGVAALTTANPQTWNGDFTFAGTNGFDLGTGAVTMTVNTQVTVAANTLTIGGIIGGPFFALTKDGAGTLLLKALNTFNGGLNVNNGAVTVDTSALVSTANPLNTNVVTVANGAALTINPGGNQVTFANSFAGGGTVNIGGSIVAASNETFTGNWSGFTGTVNIVTGGGNKASFTNAAFSPFDPAAIVNVTPGATFFTSAKAFSNIFTIAGTGNTENRGAIRMDNGTSLNGNVVLLGNATFGNSTGGNTSTIIGDVSESGGAFSLSTATVMGNAESTIALAGNNTYSGGTTINAGIIRANSDTALGAGTVTLSATANRLVINDGNTIANPIVITAGGGTAGRGKIENSGAGIGTVAGSVTINGASGAGGHFASTGGGTLAVNGAVTSSVPVTVRAGNVAFSGGGSYAAMNIFTGNTSIGADDGIATTAVLDVATTGGAGATTLDLAGFDQEIAGLIRTSANSSTVTNSSLTESILEINVAGAASYSYAGLITGNLALTKSGTGTQVLKTTESYTGATNVTGGTLGFAASQTLTSLTIADGATVVLDATLAAPAPALFEDDGFAGSSAAPVPEPGTAALLFGGMLAIFGLRRRS